MLRKLKNKAACMAQHIKDIPVAYLVIPASMLICAFIIRLFGSARCMSIAFAGGAGLFPCEFQYMLLYTVRVAIAGVLFTSALFSCKYDVRVRAVVFGGALCCMMLFEYKLIFSYCSFLPAAILCVCCGAAAFFSLINQRQCAKPVMISAIVYLFLESILLIQIISLLFCI